MQPAEGTMVPASAADVPTGTGQDISPSLDKKTERNKTIKSNEPTAAPENPQSSPTETAEKLPVVDPMKGNALDKIDKTTKPQDKLTRQHSGGSDASEEDVVARTIAAAKEGAAREAAAREALLNPRKAPPKPFPSPPNRNGLNNKSSSANQDAAVYQTAMLRVQSTISNIQSKIERNQNEKISADDLQAVYDQFDAMIKHHPLYCPGALKKMSYLAADQIQHYRKLEMESQQKADMNKRLQQQKAKEEKQQRSRQAASRNNKANNNNNNNKTVAAGGTGGRFDHSWKQLSKGGSPSTWDRGNSASFYSAHPEHSSYTNVSGDHHHNPWSQPGAAPPPHHYSSYGGGHPPPPPGFYDHPHMSYHPDHYQHSHPPPPPPAAQAAGSDFMNNKERIAADLRRLMDMLHGPPDQTNSQYSSYTLDDSSFHQQHHRVDSLPPPPTAAVDELAASALVALGTGAGSGDDSQPMEEEEPRPVSRGRGRPRRSKPNKRYMDEFEESFEDPYPSSNKKRQQNPLPPPVPNALQFQAPPLTSQPQVRGQIESQLYDLLNQLNDNRRK